MSDFTDFITEDINTLHRLFDAIDDIGVAVDTARDINAYQCDPDTDIVVSRGLKDVTSILNGLSDFVEETIEELKQKADQDSDR